MLILLIAVLIAAGAGGIAVLLAQHRRHELDKAITAARNIVQEDMLNYAIKNPQHAGVLPPPAPRRLMVLLQLNTRPVQRFVFDPGKEVRIGRDPTKCQLQLRDPQISQQHCRLFLYKGMAVLQDLNSANGTCLQRGLFRQTTLPRGGSVPLKEGDLICLGSVRIKLHLFVFDDRVM